MTTKKNKLAKAAIIEHAIRNGYKYAYGNSGLMSAICEGGTTKTLQNAVIYAESEFKANNPSNNESTESLINNGSIWIYDLTEEFNNM